MQKLKYLNALCDTGLVTIIRSADRQTAVNLAKAVADGGVRAIEVTFTVPQAHRVLEALAETFSGTDVILGAGTVLDAETARIAILSGADFVVSPSLNENIIRLANRYQKPVIAGAGTTTEMVNALEAGADIVKVFPSTIFGPAGIKDLLGPLPQAPLLPTGGVDLDNVADFIRAGVVAVGVGGEITRAGAKNNDFALVTRTAEQFIKRIQAARAG